MNRYSPWKQKRPEHHGSYFTTPHTIGQKIDQFVNANMDLDIDTKRTSLKASASVVSLILVIGGTMMFACSGTIIGCEDVNGTYISTILTSTTLLRSPTDSNAVPDDLLRWFLVNVCVMDGKLFKGCVIAYDFHFNIISIETDVALPTAIIRPLDDSISIDPSEIACTGDKEMISKSFQLHCHSNLFRLCPGDMVVAIGRSCTGTRELMAAPGKFRKSHQPWLGMEMTNLYAASAGKLEKIISKFNISKSVLVEEYVIKGSPAEQAGILHGDVIVQCGKKVVESFFGGWSPCARHMGNILFNHLVRGGDLSGDEKNPEEEINPSANPSSKPHLTYDPQSSQSVRGSPRGRPAANIAESQGPLRSCHLDPSIG
ncbi:hypothetical protein LOK49_LG02G04060 [Camellia lanceoleosa]|uniref:Uncharacterized protein n=1 Tax=Camellia lanceoleosa TaxID=1840588 RepID=A0ACC0IM09_9ERIC|nr:hypothetical protein LOK49_LG02G04060 [Camellia lanceoleosa]